MLWLTIDNESYNIGNCIKVSRFGGAVPRYILYFVGGFQITVTDTAVIGRIDNWLATNASGGKPNAA